MAITYRDIDDLTQKSSVAGTEKLPVSATEYITPAQIAAPPAIVTSQPAGGFAPNVVYDLGTLTGSVTFSLATPSDNTIANPYHWTFETGSTAPTITWPSSIIWNTGSAPTIGASKHYEILVRKGYASCLEFALS